MSDLSLPVPARALSPLGFYQRRRWFLVAMAAPALAYILVVAVWPILQGMYFSLFDYNLLKPHRTKFVGLQNYLEVFDTPANRAAFVNTVIFTAAAVTIELVLGFGLALALWRDSRFNRIALALVLVPVTITPLVVGLIWRALLLPDFGLLGYWLAHWGLSDPRGLLADPHSALATLIAIDVWEWTPMMALILLAGLKSLPSDILEASRTDGATGWQRVRLIVLPLMLPAVLLALMIRSVDAFRVFDSVYVTTGGGPGNSTNTLMLQAVKEGLQFFDIGAASTLGNVTLLCIALIAGGLIAVIRRADRRANG
ncbi:sugar ABC transporter permease [Pseudooceanicola sp. CBS1P-1]|uniref:ABC transporter permease subunit n=1 Tax=Pseudooceanicola albus TaxID=2692189 RepID=A0A6L7G5M4_9RHOB|nr:MULTISPECIES: sugar ABC transporter permease [Pseudooceanicola]MBT9385925.1 sugar ABC transporter permease [Pseudooceanicola endophyticus]MXN19654.1 ABC transporter permease subunit [Pseudooceanicola albus]